MRLRVGNILFLFAVMVWGFAYAQNSKFEYYYKKVNEFKNQDFIKSKLYVDSAKAIAKTENSNLLLARVYNLDCAVLTANAKYDMAYAQLEIARTYVEKTNDKTLIADVNSNYGIYFEKKGDYTKSLNYQLKALVIRQELKKPELICASYQNIGALYFYLGNYPLSEKNTRKALELAEQLNNIKLLGEMNLNLGAIYFTMYKDSLAQYHMLKGLEYAIKGNNNYGIENAYNNLAAYYVDTDRPLIAKTYLQKAVLLLNGNPDRATSIMQNLGKVYERLNKPDSALFYYNKALDYAKLVGNKHNTFNIYKDLSTFYYTQKDFENAYDNQHRFHLLKDSLTNEANQKNIAELEVIYKTENQEKKIEVLNAENKMEKEKSENNKKLLLVSLGGLLLAIVAAIAFYRNFVNKKKDNIALQEKNVEIEKQKNLIAEKNKEIVDSINYAKRLQEAILPSVELIQKQIPQSFIVYKPKDIVAGDFYWMFSGGKKSETLIAVADCTGHGVPGALVSVVCANALNTAVKEFGLTEPAKILDKVNELVEETFSKSDAEVKDGMDISLLKIEAVNDHPDNKLPKGKLVLPKGQSLAEFVEANKKYNIQWAGANNPLWYIKDGEWQEIKADKQPVGKFEYRKAFTNHTLQLKVNDSLYLITDGFADQFGGEHGKKINAKSLKDLLFKNSNALSQTQKEILENEFATWKGSNEQVDDVCIMGVRL